MVLCHVQRLTDPLHRPFAPAVQIPGEASCPILAQALEEWVPHLAFG
jgi:hypothetical protein